MSKVLPPVLVLGVASSEVSSSLSVSKETHVFILKNRDVIKPLFRSMMSSFCICPFCEYSAGNNGSINNHIRVHYRLVLECGFANCSVVMYDAERMVSHGKDKHKLETDA